MSTSLSQAPARQPILDIRDLSVSFETQDGRVEAVKKLSFDVARGELVCRFGVGGEVELVSFLVRIGLRWPL